MISDDGPNPCCSGFLSQCRVHVQLESGFWWSPPFLPLPNRCIATILAVNLSPSFKESTGFSNNAAMVDMYVVPYAPADVLLRSSLSARGVRVTLALTHGVAKSIHAASHPFTWWSSFSMAPTSATHRATLKKFLVCQLLPRFPRGWRPLFISKKEKSFLRIRQSSGARCNDAMLQNNLQSLISICHQVSNLPKADGFLINTFHSLEDQWNWNWWRGRGVNGSGVNQLALERLYTPPKKMGGLDIKSIHRHNVALLAKQGWQLLTSPSSMVARILQAKYYANSSFL
nr:ribonuclease H [Ipomoea batatas]